LNDGSGSPQWAGAESALERLRKHKEAKKRYQQSVNLLRRWQLEQLLLDRGASIEYVQAEVDSYMRTTW